MKDTILWAKESDRYTERARELHHGKLYDGALDAADAKLIAKMLPRGRRIRRILDIGCGYGGLTAALARVFPRAEIVGIDPGTRTVAAARRALREFRNVSFQVGHAHAIEQHEPFDLVVLRMVLQWVPRTHLLQTVAEIDRLCRSFVFIQDFYPSTPRTSVSVHNREVRIFKQNYPAIFESLPSYRRVTQLVEDAEHGDDFQRGKFLLEKLPLLDSYRRVKPVQEKDKRAR